MTTLIILLAAGTMLLLAVLMGYILGWANRTFAVEVHPLVDAAIKVLPGANCGGCGYVGCGEYAEALVAGKAEPDRCPVGGPAVAAALAKIMGIDLKETFPKRPVVHCGATADQRLKKGLYHGEQTCAAANILSGVQGCTYGCLGLGDCEVACPFNAIHIIDGLAKVDYDKCTGCGACERACPRHIISMVPFKASQMLVIACSNHDFGKDVKAVCRVGCIGCKACERNSPLFRMADNLPQIDYERYDPGRLEELEVPKVLDKCPMKGLVYVGKPSEKIKRQVADEELPEVVTDRFKTTADETEWRG